MTKKATEAKLRRIVQSGQPASLDWAEVDAIREPAEFVAPPGCFTNKIIMEHYKVGSTAANKLSSKMVAAGKWEKCGGGSRTYYRPKKSLA